MRRITLYFALLLSIGGGLAHAAQADLLAAYDALEDHINGVTTLTTAQINTQKAKINNNKQNAGDNSSMITASFSLIETYESVKGPLFINGTTSGGFSRTDTSNANKALAHAMILVYQAIIDDAYTPWTLSNHQAALVGKKFDSADYFPGDVAPPADPNAVYSVQINASQPEAWGYEVQFQQESARRPTGAYLAPGSIATVTVPAAIVGKGYEIRVGAHVADLSNRPNDYKRLNRVTLTYPITSTSTEIASPLGGGIYIEVPYGEDEGLVTIDFQNTVRAPFYSNSVARTTTLTEWQNTERAHPGTWADFETDKFMLTVPTDWIYNYNDPVSLMDNWDDSMDVLSRLQGLPLIRPKTVLYCIIDMTLDANVFSPGYPQSNDNYNPASATSGSEAGNKDHEYLNGPLTTGDEFFHEFGHAAYINKFSGETESAVNLFHAAVHHQIGSKSIDQAFRYSRWTTNGHTVDRGVAAISWAVTSTFRNGNPMETGQKSYQHRGHAHYVDNAALFGWDSLGDFYKSVAEDFENGTSYTPRNGVPTDSRIIRMSRAAGANLMPLLHFWGTHPGNRTSIENTLAGEGIGHSAAIYDRLVYYKSIIPMSASAFSNYHNKIWNIQLSSENAQNLAWRTSWNSTLGQASKDEVQAIIDLYFTNGRPVESLPYFEGFEDGVSGWSQATNDNYDWRRHSGDTFSPAAGPNQAATGDHYIYAEGHDSGGSNKTASYQCVFDFSANRETTLSFDYHMYGNYIDFLAVDVYDGTSWTNDVWVKNGKQHNSSSAPWSSATVDLTSFTGNDEVTIRFRTANTQYNSADPAIDNIQIDLGSVSLPYYEDFENGFGVWEQSADDDFDWTRNSGSTPTGATGPSAASSGSWYLYIEPNDVYNGHNKVAFIDAIFDMSTVSAPKLRFDFHMYGVNVDYLAVDVHDGTTWTTDVWKLTKAEHNVDAWANAIIDLSSYAGNNAVTIRFRAKQGYWHVSDIAIDNIVVEERQTLPYAESFESGIGAWEQSTDDDYDWTHHTGGTESGAAGPVGASDGIYYLYAEGHHGLGSNKVSSVYCAFDFSGATAPELTFDYHMRGYYIDYLSLDVHDGTQWIEAVWFKNNQQHLSSEAPWSNAMVDLTAYAGNANVILRFRTANTDYNSADPAIDNIQIVDVPPLSPIESWRMSHFGTSDDLGDAADSANPDFDTLNNFLEFALGTNPMVFDSPYQSMVPGETSMLIDYTRRKMSGYSIYAKWSPNLQPGSWNTAGISEAVTADDGEIETVTVTVPYAPGQDQKFVRIVVE